MTTAGDGGTPRPAEMPPDGGLMAEGGRWVATHIDRKSLS